MFFQTSHYSKETHKFLPPVIVLAILKILHETAHSGSYKPVLGRNSLSLGFITKALPQNSLLDVYGSLIVITWNIPLL